MRLPFAFLLSLSVAACDVTDPHYVDPIDGARPDGDTSVDAGPDAAIECEQLIAFHRADGIYVIQPDGAGLDNIVTGSEEQYAQWSPDGKRLLFEAKMVDGTTDLFVANADGTGSSNLTNIAGHDRLASWSPDGSRIAFLSQRDDGTTAEDLYIMNADGSSQQRIGEKASAPAWSPDGTRIAFGSYASGRFQVYLVGPDGQNLGRITNNSFSDNTPRFSPDGTKLAFNSLRGGFGVQVFVMNADGSGQNNVSPTFAGATGHVWSPDGTRIAFHGSLTADDSEDVFLIDPDGTDLFELTAGSTSASREAAWSPDGTQIVFSTDRDGNDELYRVNIDRSGLLRLSTTPFHTEHSPAWATCE